MGSLRGRLSATSIQAVPWFTPTQDFVRAGGAKLRSSPVLMSVTQRARPSRLSHWVRRLAVDRCSTPTATSIFWSILCGESHLVAYLPYQAHHRLSQAFIVHPCVDRVLQRERVLLVVAQSTSVDQVLDAQSRVDLGHFLTRLLALHHVIKPLVFEADDSVKLTRHCETNLPDCPVKPIDSNPGWLCPRYLGQRDVHICHDTVQPPQEIR